MENNPKKQLKKEVREKTAGYITAAFGLIAGLAWNDAITDLIDKVFPMGNGGLVVKFIYAGVLTVLLVLITTYIVKLSQE